MQAPGGLATPGGAPDAVHKQLGLRREVEVDDVVQQRDVDAAGGHIRDDQELRAAGPELGDVDLARCLCAQQCWHNLD